MAPGKRPNFFIVGAPKCGTTAMNNYLARHPDVYVAPRKEIHFFGSDLRFTVPRPTEAEYLAHFRDANGAKAVGEGSVWYMVSEKAAGEIKAFAPDARIIIMLREPASMMYSLHSENVWNSAEDIADFAEALAAEPNRAGGKASAKHAFLVDGLLYRRVAAYTDQVRRYFDAFGRENVHVIIFDDFKADTPAAYRGALDFLGVDPSFETNLSVVNPNKQIRNRWVQRFFYCNPLARSFRFRRLIPQRARDFLRGLNTRHAKRNPLDDNLRRRLREEFAPEVQRLSELLGRDLTHWSR